MKTSIAHRASPWIGGALLLASVAAQASGYRPPSHAQLTYSFTCPSGASGHLAYTRDFDTAPVTRLQLWVNGRYLQDRPDIARALKVRSIEKVQASCEGESTVLFLQTFEPSRGEDGSLATVTLHVDRAGNVAPLDE